jgi:hypothetical protein
MKTIIVAIILMTFVLVACKDDNPLNPVQKIFLLQSGTEITNVSDLIDSYLNDPELVGVIEFSSTLRNDLGFYHLNNQKIIQNYDGIDNYAYAAFRDPYNNPITVDNLLINASLLREYNPGAYAKVGNDELDLYFNGSTSNKFYIENLNNSWLPDSVYDQVTFSNRIEMTNIQRYDTVSKSQGFNVQWTGGSNNGKVMIEFNLNDYSESDTTSSSGFYEITDNDGSFTITPIRVKNTGPSNHFFDISITSYDPIMRTLSNGKKIILLGTTKNTKTVFLVD